jgi:hypothetical protein
MYNPRRQQFLGANPDPQLRQPGPLQVNMPPDVQYVEDWYAYVPSTISALAAGGSSIFNILMDADSDFKLSKLTQMSDIAGAAQTESSAVIPLVTMDIVDAGSGRKLFSNPIPMGAIFGAGRLPFILPVPRIFTARSSISVTLANYSNATTYNIRLAFIGAKLFAGTPNPTYG